MSHTFSLVCEETQRKIWVGQGWGKMTTFYSGEKDTMVLLGEFLAAHQDKPLRLLQDQDVPDDCEEWKHEPTN